MKVVAHVLIFMALAGPAIAGDHRGLSLSSAIETGAEGSWFLAAPCAAGAEAPSAPFGFTLAPQAAPPESQEPPLSTLASRAVLRLEDTPTALAAGLGPSDQLTDLTGLSRSTSSTKSIDWGPLLSQSLFFSVVQHSWRITFEDGTWRETEEGPFWDDYINSVKGLCCWDDGDRNTTNYIFHPLLGSEAAMIFSNNHRASRLTRPGAKGYWNAKFKQGLYSLAYSTYFELGLVLSETAIGNVGLDEGEMTYLDLVVTPLAGTLLSAGEDFMRQYLIEPVNRRNHFWGATLAIFLNPARSFSNLMAFKTPWDDPDWIKLQRAEGRR